MKGIKKHILSVASLLFIIGLSAHAYEWSRVDKAGGSGYDGGQAIAIDSQNNQYISGAFSGSASFGSTTLISSGDTDVFVAKLDTNGNWLWAMKAGGSLGDASYGIAVASDGSIYLTGYFYGFATFGLTSLTSGGSQDLFVAKLDATGNWIWAKKAGGSGNEYGSSIAIDVNANVYLTGYFQGNAHFGTTSLSSSGEYDIFVTKLDTNGNWLWAKRAGGIGNDSGYDLAVDSDANVFITGYFTGNANFGSFSLSSNGGYDLFVAKLDTNGNWLMAIRAGGQLDDIARGIALGTDGNAYLTGHFSFYSFFGSFTLQGIGLYDIFIAKLDSNGNWVWAYRAGGLDSDIGYDIAVDANTNIYLTGDFRGTADFGTTSLSSNGVYDIFVAKLDTNGNWLMALSAGGINQDNCRGITVDEDGCVFLTGFFEWSASFGTVSLVSNGYEDVFIVKLSPPDPIVSFSADVTEGLGPLDIQFTDSSLPGGAPITDWFWDFGDGGTSVAQNPVHTYLLPGIYSVSLSVTNGLNLNSVKERINYINVLEQVWQLTLIGNQTMNFGSVFVEEHSADYPIVLYNTGTMDINISNVYTTESPSHFELISPFQQFNLAHGETESVIIRFSPQLVGEISDTLCIVNNSSNQPILKIKLTGTGLHVQPKAPQMVYVSMSGNNAHLSWEPVIENMHDVAMTPDYYFIYSANKPEGEYVFLGLTQNLSYIHPNVGLGAKRMFYRVTAVKFYRDVISCSDLDIYLKLNLIEGMAESDIHRRIAEFCR